MMMIPAGSTIGILGGGQLGLMLGLAAIPLGYKVHIFSPEEECPAKAIATSLTVAPYTDHQALKEFAAEVQVITCEFEHIPCESLKLLEQMVPVRPNWYCLYIAQERLREKHFAKEVGIRTAPFREVSDRQSLEQALADLGYPAILKTVSEGYDGKGQYILEDSSTLPAILKLLDQSSHRWILEKKIALQTEISVLVARTPSGEMQCFPVTENEHRQGILYQSRVPAMIDETLQTQALRYAAQLAEALPLVGLLAVEFFVTENGELLFNEMAPRPHNSGHWTIDGCITSQFEQCIRAICDLPLAETAYFIPSLMTNLIGDAIEEIPSYLKNPRVKAHHYGKKEIKAGRKMGHVTELIPPLKG